jgi:hypothetical protein
MGPCGTAVGRYSSRIANMIGRSSTPYLTAPSNSGAHASRPSPASLHEHLRRIGIGVEVDGHQFMLGRVQDFVVAHAVLERAGRSWVSIEELAIRTREGHASGSISLQWRLSRIGLAGWSYG